MKTVFLLVLALSQMASAHEGHNHELKALSPPPGTSIFQLDSVWKNQRGESVKLGSLRGHPRMVVMLFTKCQTACPLIADDLKSIAAEVDAKRSSKIEVSIFSLDSFRETPESLAAFVVKRKLPAHWGLFTANADSVAELAAALGVRYKRLPSGDYIHSNVIYFLNGNGEIVAQKEGIKTPREDFVKKIAKGL